MKRKCVVCRGWIRSARKLRRLPLAGKPCAHVGCLKRALVWYAAEIRKQTEEIKSDYENVLARFVTFTDKRGKPVFAKGRGRFGVKTGNLVGR